jgi:hypothetical protein
MRRRVIILFSAVLMSVLACAQTRSVTITEPGIYEIGELFKTADVIALVHILSGDAENYDCAVYKGEVVQSFKGSQRGAIIYFGPFVGHKLGDDYFVFLRNMDQPITPKTTANASYGTIHYAKVFNQGYSSMEMSYECVFDGDEVLPKCDYAVRVCTDYIKLPKAMVTYPPEENDPPFGCRWVRKSGFFALLDSLGGPKK